MTGLRGWLAATDRLNLTRVMPAQGVRNRQPLAQTAAFFLSPDEEATS